MVSERAELSKKDLILIEALARDEHCSVEEVGEIYRIECMHLEQSAKIKTYVPVLASKAVRQKLREVKQAESGEN